MITFATEGKIENKDKIMSELATIFPDEYDILIEEFGKRVWERSRIVGESQFDIKFRVNVTTKEDVLNFLKKFGEKSGTSYNTFKGDKNRKGSKVIFSGARKCHHAVRRHHLKEGTNNSRTGRKPGAERQTGKNTECPAKLSFSLSGEKLHTSKEKKRLK